MFNCLDVTLLGNSKIINIFVHYTRFVAIMESACNLALFIQTGLTVLIISFLGYQVHITNILLRLQFLNIFLLHSHKLIKK